MFKDGTKQSDTQKPHDVKYLLCKKKHYYYHYHYHYHYHHFIAQVM